MMACAPQSHCAVLLIFMIELFGTWPYMTQPIELTAANVSESTYNLVYAVCHPVSSFHLRVLKSVTYYHFFNIDERQKL